MRTKTSDGAARAADGIMASLQGYGVNTVNRRNETAEIIERETRAGELEAFARAYLETWPAAGDDDKLAVMAKAALRGAP